MVIYTSDQGYFLGEHNYFDKRFRRKSEDAVCGSSASSHSGRSQGRPHDPERRFCSNVARLCGAGDTGHYAGRIFSPYLSGLVKKREEPLFITAIGKTVSPRRPAHYGVRTQTAKLIYYDGLVTESEAHKWEFYDLLTDPTETTNQYDQVEGDVSIKALVDELFSWRKKSRGSVKFLKTGQLLRGELFNKPFRKRFFLGEFSNSDTNPSSQHLQGFLRLLLI